VINFGKEINKQEKEIMPHPRATPVRVSPLQQDLLQRLVRRSTSQERLVRRGKIILAAAAGASTTKIVQELHLDHETVRLWRDRWHAAESRLQAIEETGKQKVLSQALEQLLTDEPRPGTPTTSDRPVSSWTPQELADEAVKRGIVAQISSRTVERFLKGERVAAASQAVLAHSAAR
jgi:putative transposase